jgi:hypothetical protein
MPAVLLCTAFLLAPASIQAKAPPAASTGTISIPLNTASAADISAAIAQVSSGRTPRERQEAIRVLRRTPYRGPRAFRALSAVMSDDRNNEVRQAAAVALLDYEGSETIKRMETFFKGEFADDTRRVVCVALATAPAQAEDPGVTGILIGLLADDPSSAVRWAAIDGISARRDQSALGALQHAADYDQDLLVRSAAATAYRKLSHLPQMKRHQPPSKSKRASYDAVEGKDPCPPGNGWCACSLPPLKTRPRCIPRAECEHTYYNSYQSLGFTCDWDGEIIK